MKFSLYKGPFGWYWYSNIQPPNLDKYIGPFPSLKNDCFDAQTKMPVHHRKSYLQKQSC